MIVEQHLDGGGFGGCKTEAIDRILVNGRYATTGIEENFVWAMEDCDDGCAHGKNLRMWMLVCPWGCAPSNTPLLSFSTGRPSNCGRRTLLAHSVCVFDCSISYNVFSHAHSYCKQNT